MRYEINDVKIKTITIILVFAGLLLASCKNQNSTETSTETDDINTQKQIYVESEDEKEYARFLDKIENFILTEYLTERDLRTISNEQRKFQLQQIDLNNDGKKEIFINLVTSYFCGTGGCTVLLLNDNLELITEFTVTRTPIYVEKTVENGWRVLMVQSEGKWRKLIYEVGSYPSNPSVVERNSDAPSEGASVLFDNDNEKLKTYTF